jgi:hypothetical protein
MLHCANIMLSTAPTLPRSPLIPTSFSPPPLSLATVQITYLPTCHHTHIYTHLHIFHTASKSCAQTHTATHPNTNTDTHTAKHTLTVEVKLNERLAVGHALPRQHFKARRAHATPCFHVTSRQNTQPTPRLVPVTGRAGGTGRGRGAERSTSSVSLPLHASLTHTLLCILTTSQCSCLSPHAQLTHPRTTTGKHTHIHPHTHASIYTCTHACCRKCIHNITHLEGQA